MYRAFNMGIGFVLVVAPPDAGRARSVLESFGLRVHELGRATGDAGRTIRLGPPNLVGRDGRFA